MKTRIGNNQIVKAQTALCKKFGFPIVKTNETVEVKDGAKIVFAALRMGPNKWVCRYSPDYWPV